MKLPNRLISTVLTAVVVTTMAFAPASHAASDCDYVAKHITTAQTPDKGFVKWSVKFRETTGTAYNSTPCFTASNIYIYSYKSLYCLDYNGNILKKLDLATEMNSACKMILQDDSLYIPLSKGNIVCVDIGTFSQKWTFNMQEGQSLCNILYHEGMIYTGVTNGAGTEGAFYGINADTGKEAWRYSCDEDPCGFYWSGAATDGKYIVFGGDNGKIVIHDAKENILYDVKDIEDTPLVDTKKIRSSVIYDAESGCFYLNSTAANIYRFSLDGDGKITDLIGESLGESKLSNANCTTAPIIYKNKIFSCSHQNSEGCITILSKDFSQKKVIRREGSPLADIKSTPLISEVNNSSDHKISIYFTQNFPPGGIYSLTYLYDKEQYSEVNTVFEPVNDKQFCISDIAADESGNLYYSNDSGRFFCIRQRKDGDVDPTPRPTVTPAASPSPTGNPSIAKKTSKASDKMNKVLKKYKKSGLIKPPKRIKFISKKKSGKKHIVTFKWIKGKKSKKTLIILLRTTKTTTYYKSFIIAGKKKTIKLSKGKYKVYFYGLNNKKISSKRVYKKVGIV